MNILIPHQWLLDHLKTNAKPDQIQKFLSLSGPSVENIYETGSEKVFDIEVTTNRADSMSVRGIAREAAVILDRYDIKSQLKPLNLKQKIEPEAETLPLPEINNSPDLCNRILCVVLTNVEQRPTPDWMAERLRQADIQVKNSVVDITNYLTHDLGHPCHVFDYDKIMELGGVINVAAANPGKPFETLDGALHETVGGEIVFTNNVGTIIDLPAIIGTKNSSVDENTQNILFWIEDLDPQKVRQASMEHAIRTVAAQLNEKNVDPHLGLSVLKKGIELYQKITNAKTASLIFDDFPHPRQLDPIILKKELIHTYLGIDLETAEIEEILTKLGCEVKIEQLENQPTKTAEIQVQPPTFRPDLQIPADVIEELARIYGYQKLPSTLMAGELPVNEPEDTHFKLENKIKQFLADIGWQEIFTFSMVSSELAAQSGFKPAEHLKLSNPLTADNTHLRRSLIPSLEEALLENPQAEKLSVFEIANVYHPQENELPAEEMMLGMLSKKNYRKVRGDLEALLDRFYLEGIRIKPVEEQAGSNQQHYQQQGEVYLKTADQENEEDHKLGRVYILDNQHVGFELNLQMLLSAAHTHPKYQQPLKTTPIIEDLTFTLTPNTLVGRVVEAIYETDPLVKKVELKDIYQQNYTFTIEYQHAQENLTSEQVAPVREAVVDKIKDEFGAKLVGQV